MKRQSKLTLILCGLCAFVWTAAAVLGLAFRIYHDHLFQCVSNVVCAFAWIFIFFLNLKRYRKYKAQESETAGEQETAAEQGTVPAREAAAEPETVPESETAAEPELLPAQDEIPE